ncbi:MAG TPA: hypothetical protein VEI97_15265 [bacterium]|nr:hypothetical protein [bacterium]
MKPHNAASLALDYRAIGLAPRASDIVVFFIDLAEYGFLDEANRRLLGFLAEGYSSREIAHLMGTSERTANRKVAALRHRLTNYALSS